MNKENAVYTHNGISLSLKREENIAIWDSIDCMEDTVLNLTGQKQKDKYCMIRKVSKPVNREE
jgi:hypothetical protein